MSIINPHLNVRVWRVIWRIKGRVKGIEIPAVQMLLHIAEGFTESLEMDDFSFSQETDGIADFRILYYPQDIFIGRTGLLFCCQILEQIRNRIAFGLEFAGIEGNASCCLGPDARSVVNIVRT